MRQVGLALASARTVPLFAAQTRLRGERTCVRGITSPPRAGQGRGTTIYQEGRIASFCESRENLGPGMEAVLAVPQDGMVPGHIPRPPGAHRPQPAPVQRRRTRLSGHHPRAPRGLPRALLPRGTVGETLRAE